MKARYRGVDVEGTPDEVAHFVKLLAPLNEQGTIQPELVAVHVAHTNPCACSGQVYYGCGCSPEPPMAGEAHV